MLRMSLVSLFTRPCNSAASKPTLQPRPTYAGPVDRTKPSIWTRNPNYIGHPVRARRAPDYERRTARRPVNPVHVPSQPRSRPRMCCSMLDPRSPRKFRVTPALRRRHKAHPASPPCCFWVPRATPTPPTFCRCMTRRSRLSTLRILPVLGFVGHAFVRCRLYMDRSHYN